MLIDFDCILLRLMKSFVRNITVKSFAFLIIGMIGLLIANQGLFLHPHILENGTIVSHSHPYDKNQDSEPYKQHHHTKAEFLFYSNLNILFLSVLLIVSFLSLISKNISFVDVEKNYFRFFSFSFLGRAPPVS